MQSEKYIVEFFKSTGKIPKLSGFRFEDPFQTAFKLPPERALEWLKQRGKNLKISSDWEELDAEAHNKAFTVAKVMSADILQMIYDYVERAKSEGMTLKQFQESLLPELEKNGWTGASPSRLKTIYDTNMQMAYAQGKYRQQKLISHIYPYWKYTQIQRPTKRHNHSLLHGKVFRHDDPIWDLIYPPSGFGCKCSVTPIKDGTNAEEGNHFLNNILNKDDFTLKPVTAWKVETEKYTLNIKNSLLKMINQKQNDTIQAPKNRMAAFKNAEKVLKNLDSSKVNTFIKENFDKELTSFCKQQKLDINVVKANMDKFVRRFNALCLSPEVRLQICISPKKLEKLFESEEKRFKQKLEVVEKDEFKRDKCELETLKIGRTSEKQFRPIYGALWDSNIELKNNILLAYGSTVVVLKDDKKRMSSFTAGDTLGNGGAGYRGAFRIGEATAEKLFSKKGGNNLTLIKESILGLENIGDSFNLLEARKFLNLNGFNCDYFEAQILGQVLIDDIEYVTGEITSELKILCEQNQIKTK